MTKTQSIAAFAEKTGMSKSQAAQILDNLAEVACREAGQGFVFPGLGKLVLVQRKARMGRNPATGAEIQIPAKTAVKFRVSKACKDSVIK